MSTRRTPGSPEDLFFLAASILSLCAAAATLVLRSHLHLANERLRYGFDHLPGALVEIALFLAAVALSRRALLRAADLEARPTALYVLAIAIVFGLFWLPVYLAGGFAEDDWLLLAAASVRKLILVHPSLSWYTLDSVDGNFRPLGTVLYFGYMLKAFGLAAHAFTLGPFLLTFLASLVAFALVRELGYGKVAAAAASLLFLSRGMIYTVVAWASALGDSLAILLCSLTALLILKAHKRTGAAVPALHLLAWLSFALATLAKQSAFVTPLIVALLLLLRPGQDRYPALSRRLASAALALFLYSATAAFVFLHAKSLLRAPSPYRIDLSLQSLFQSFSYLTWYLLVLRFPDRFPIANLLPALLGIILLATLILQPRRHPRLLGDRPRDVVFASLAAVASLSLFLLLGTRSAPYYGSMAAFWFSIALAIALTRFGHPHVHQAAARACCFVFCLLLASGFGEIRLEQTALLPSGGYLWGTYSMDMERAIYVSMHAQLAPSQQATALVLADCPSANLYTSMAIIDAPNLNRTLIQDTRTGLYFANNRQGLRPDDNLANLNDPDAYHWKSPLDAADALRALTQSSVLELQCRGGRIEPATGAGQVLP